MKIVATGATSFVGSGAVKALLERGHKVYAVLRKGSSKADRLLINGAMPENLVILEEDLGSLERLAEQIPEPCDVFLHMGWKGAGSDSRSAAAIQEENAKDSLNAVQAEYGVHDALMNEETGCRPTSPYGEAKLKVRIEAEALCRKLSMDYGHARIFSTYGIGDHPWSLLSTCVNTFLSGGVMEMGACTQDWNFMYIDDAGRAVAMLCEYQKSLMEQGCVYNLGGPMDETGPLKHFVETVYEMCGRKGSCVYGVRKPNAEGVVNLIPDLTKMKRVIGWEPRVRFRDGMARVIESVRPS